MAIELIAFIFIAVKKSYRAIEYEIFVMNSLKLLKFYDAV